MCSFEHNIDFLHPYIYLYNYIYIYIYIYDTYIYVYTYAVGRRSDPLIAVLKRGQLCSCLDVVHDFKWQETYTNDHS